MGGGGGVGCWGGVGGGGGVVKWGGRGLVMEEWDRIG